MSHQNNQNMRLDQSTTEDPSSIETIFCEGLKKEKTIPLSEEQMKMLLSLLVMDEEESQKLYDELTKEFFMIKIFEDRLKATGRELNKAGLAFVSLCCTTPGEAVMYAYYIASQMKRKELGQKIDLQTLCMEIFPFGIFSRESLEKAWDGQKIERESGSDNLLDYAKASESLTYN
jgi:hypothetical protein